MSWTYVALGSLLLVNELHERLEPLFHGTREAFLLGFDLIQLLLQRLQNLLRGLIQVQLVVLLDLDGLGPLGEGCQCNSNTVNKPSDPHTHKLP